MDDTNTLRAFAQAVLDEYRSKTYSLLAFEAKLSKLGEVLAQPESAPTPPVALPAVVDAEARQEAERIGKLVVNAIERVYRDTEQSVPWAFCQEATDAAYSAVLDATTHPAPAAGASTEVQAPIPQASGEAVAWAHTLTFDGKVMDATCTFSKASPFPDSTRPRFAHTAFPLYRHPAPPASASTASRVEGEQTYYIDEEMAGLLRQTIGDDGDPSAIKLSIGDGHSGWGLYVSLAEYPEEGAIQLVEAAAPTPTPAPEARKPLKEGRIEDAWMECRARSRQSCFEAGTNRGGGSISFPR